jgi:hypothetical protein
VKYGRRDGAPVWGEGVYADASRSHLLVLLMRVLAAIADAA